MHAVLYLCAAAVVLPGDLLLVELTVPGARVPPWVVAWRMWRRPVPLAAIALVLVMLAMGVAQIVHPAIIGDLERAPHGGWWRCVTGLLVQSSGWTQLVFNFAALLAVAPVAARTLGNWWTLTVYLVAGVAAQAVSAAGWSPHGGGNSVAICGLVGALAIGYARRGARRELRILLLLIPAAGAVLCALTNNHGVGLLVGGLLGVLLAGRRASNRPSVRPAGGGATPAG